MAELHVGGEPSAKTPTAEKTTHALADRSVAVMTEKDIVAGRLVLGEEIFEKVGPAEPPVVFRALVDRKNVVVDDVSALRREPVAGDERVVRWHRRERG